MSSCPQVKIHFCHFNSQCFLFITAPAPPRKTRGELYKDVDADYYGYRDEDDGVLVPLEQDVEKEGVSFTLGYSQDV